MLAPENSPSWGGVGSYTYDLVNNLPKDSNIHIFTIGRDVKDSYADLFGDDVQVHEIVKVSPNDTFFYNLKFQFSIFKKLKEFNKQNQYDVIHSHSGHLPHLLSQFQNIAPMVVTVHATVKGLNKSIRRYDFKTDSTESYMNVFSKGIELFEKISFNKADRLLPVSNFTLKQINEDYGVDTTNKVQVLHTAVDVNLFAPKNKELSEKPTILFAGRLYAIKGVETFLNALEIITKKKSVKALLVGRGNTGYVNQRLNSMMPSCDFSINGLISHNQMPDIFDQSDILVVPSIYENCPITILEAMSSGKIVVASNVGGIPEIITDGHNGFLFESGNHDELAAILSDILEENIDISKIQSNARNLIVQDYNWKNRGKEIHEQYKKVVL